MESKNFIDILNKSLNDTLGRSIITTVTTLFAAISLWVFTTGSIRTFAIVLTIGLISGCYSSIFISSGFIALVRRNWNPDKERKGKARPRVAEPSV
jgi:preprotein translocase subunit SecF